MRPEILYCAKGVELVGGLNSSLKDAANKYFELHPTACVAKVVVYESVPPERFINVECLVNDMTARASRFSAAPYPAVPYPEPEHLSDVFQRAMQDSELRSDFAKMMSDWIARNCRGAFLKKLGEAEVDRFWHVRMGGIGDEPSAKAHEEHSKKDEQ